MPDEMTTADYDAWAERTVWGLREVLQALDTLGGAQTPAEARLAENLRACVVQWEADRPDA